MRSFLSRLSAIEDHIHRFWNWKPLAPVEEVLEPRCDHIVGIHDSGDGPEALYWCWAGDLLYPDSDMFSFCPLCGVKLDER